MTQPVTSKASKASKTSKTSKTKGTSEQGPTEVHTPASQPLPRRIERTGGESRSRQASTLESKFKYRAPEPTFDHSQQQYWEEII